MVWAVTSRGASSGYAANPLVGDTFTPTEGNFIFVGSTGWDTQITGVTGWSITFVAAGAVTQGGYELQGWLGIVGASPGSGQAQLTTTGGSLRYAASVIEISGGDSTGTASAAIVQTPISEGSFGGGSANAIASGLSAFASSTNATIVLLGSVYESQTFTAQSGFTSYEPSPAGPGGYSEIMFDDTEQTAPTYSPITGSAHDMAIAFELAEASAGSSIIPLAMHHRNQMK